MVRQAPLEALRFSRGNYPAFVTLQQPVPLAQEVPAFMFHDVAPDSFERQLCYLSDNGYGTLSMAEFMAFLKGDFRLKTPSVLLTFDDGHKSWRETASPLLQKYGFRAVGFLVTSFIRERPDDAAWLSWPEVREIEEAGAMTFESHTAFHDRVFVGENLIDFYRPSLFSTPMELDPPWIDEDGYYTNRLPLGTPIYEYEPRLAGLPRMIDDPDVRAACVEFVVSRGGPNFFKQRGWRALLHQAWNSAIKKAPPPRFETLTEQHDRIIRDLALSRSVLEDQLGRESLHLCLPWGRGRGMAIDWSREAGFKSVFHVDTERNINRPGDSPWQVPRLKDDYIFRLPGKGRKSLASIFGRKLVRRLAGEDLY